MEKEMAIHSSILAWRIPWTEKPVYSPWGCKESDMTERFHFDFSLSCIGERNGNPLQYSCLENLMDGGAWWAAVHGVAKSRTQLSDFTFTFHFHALEKEMVTHSSVLENPRDGGACWAAVYGVAQSRTRLKRLSSSSSSRGRRKGEFLFNRNKVAVMQNEQTLVICYTNLHLCQQ